MEYLKNWLLITLTISSSMIARSQDLLDFKVVMNGVNNRFELSDTVSNYDPIHIEYESKESKNSCQQLIYPGGWKTLFCHDAQADITYYYEVDSLDRVRLYSVKTTIRLHSYEYYPSGKLKCYSQLEEDTLFNNHHIFPLHRFTADSFRHNFHENGTTESIIYYTPGVQQLVTYWPNKQKKIIAEYNANRSAYCGKYKEFDENGNLVLKGSYFLPEDPHSHPIEIGTWKYYEEGKLKKKEKMSRKHPSSWPYDEL